MTTWSAKYVFRSLYAVATPDPRAASVRALTEAALGSGVAVAEFILVV